MIKRALVVAILSTVSISASAQSVDESWTPNMRAEFRQGCASELERVGLNTSSAWRHCDCITTAAEEEFGLADFGYLAASDERDMPEITRRSEQAIKHCFE